MNTKARKNRKWTILGVFCLLAVLLAQPVLASSQGVTSSDTVQTVTFGTDEEMHSSYNDNVFREIVSNMQPGDSVTMTIVLKNEHPDTTRWYMKNDIVKSLEERSQASEGAYTYTLTYDGPSDSITIFDSNTVGGTILDGEDRDTTNYLHDATETLKEYFALDTLGSGQTGTVKLVVSLDGETQGNSYQDTLAQLTMQWMVMLDDEEITPTPTPTTTPTPTPTRKPPVKTGDETPIMPYVISAAAAGVLLLFLAIWSIRRRKQDQSED